LPVALSFASKDLEAKECTGGAQREKSGNSTGLFIGKSEIRQLKKGTKEPIELSKTYTSFEDKKRFMHEKTLAGPKVILSPGKKTGRRK